MKTLLIAAVPDMQPNELLRAMFDADPNGDFYRAAETALIEDHCFTKADITDELNRLYNEWDARQMEARKELIASHGEIY